MKKMLFLFFSFLSLIACKNVTTSESLSNGVDTANYVNSYPYSFDTILQKCFNDTADGAFNGSTTMGMIGCYYTSTENLDTLVNKIYDELYSKLDTGDKQKLKLSQEKWREYYNAESDFVYNAYYTWANFSKYGHGRDHAIMQAEWRYDVIRQRLIDLTKYNDEIFEIDSTEL